MFKTQMTTAGNNRAFITTIMNSIGGVVNGLPSVWDTPEFSGQHALTTEDFSSHGSMTFFGAQAWIGYLNTINYAGHHDWRLPHTNPAVSGANQTTSELGHLFYNELADQAETSLKPSSYNHDNLFSNLNSLTYWSGIETTSGFGNAWQFGFFDGKQNDMMKIFNAGALAVRDGNVSTVPIPAAIWFLSSGMIGLLGFSRRQ